MPWRRVPAATYTLTSATPRYTARRDTGLNAAQPRTVPSRTATKREC